MVAAVEDDVDQRVFKLELDVGKIGADVGELGTVKGALADLRVEIVRSRLWTMGLLAAMLGLMARGFHWI